MKKITFLFTLIFATLVASSQTKTLEADKILGVWQTGSGKGRIQITKYGEKFGGKIIWLKEPNDSNGNPKLDKKNPDDAKKKNTTLGINNLLGFSYEGKGKYENGTIYDPENGKTYKCIITMEGDNILKVRGYIGFSMIGRTDTWTRVN